MAHTQHNHTAYSSSGVPAYAGGSAWAKYKAKAEQQHLERVAVLGCCVCRNLKLGETPAEIHHCRSGAGTSVRACHFRTLPLYHIHHHIGGFGVAIHAGRCQWEAKFGTESELLVQALYVLGEIVGVMDA
ncbi:Ref family recombination enhancement nuclease [Serratia rhizosphaerae]|uniref:Uncharacterized protein n=1 Tax=Serratia rhizosphaerae TaxID=2597702 RepID=A0ABX6GHG5_9GAMM|nr:hypothetical protein FO014_01290 [Serratia rhizosphaerae]